MPVMRILLINGSCHDVHEAAGGLGRRRHRKWLLQLVQVGIKYSGINCSMTAMRPIPGVHSLEHRP